MASVLSKMGFNCKILYSFLNVVVILAALDIIGQPINNIVKHVTKKIALDLIFFIESSPFKFISIYRALDPLFHVSTKIILISIKIKEDFVLQLIKNRSERHVNLSIKIVEKLFTLFQKLCYS